MTLKEMERCSLGIVFAILSLPLFSGCSGRANPDGRETISGMITLNGKPLAGTAGIAFDPVNEGSDGGGKGQIMKGKYTLTGHDAVKPGKYTVRITAVIDFDKKTGKPADNTVVFGNEVAVDVVPPEFNAESTIEFEVVAGKKNVFNYDIETDYEPAMPKKIPEKSMVPL